MTQSNAVTIRRPTEGRTIGIVADIYRFLATGKETGGCYLMFEAIVLPGGGFGGNSTSNGWPTSKK